MTDERIVAYHEAGHAVVACKVDVSFSQIILEAQPECLSLSGSPLDWTGRLQHAVKGVPPDRLAKVLLAGTLAEVRFAAESEYARSTNPTITGILAKGRVSDDSLESIKESLLSTPGDKDRMYAQISFEMNGKRSSHRVFLGESLGDMHCIRCWCAEALNNIDALLRETKRLIDDARLWEGVSALAQSLLDARAVQVTRKSLSQSDVRAIIRPYIETPVV